MPPAQALPDDDPSAGFQIRPPPEKPCKDLVCANNTEDRARYERRSGDEEGDVDVEECGVEKRWEMMKGDEGATECSSSFGETYEEGERREESDGEVESSWFAENGDSVLLDGTDGGIKKKRVTDHWRKFIRPIMWRCHWLELRMKELQSQAILYDKELEAYKHEKQLRTRAVRLEYAASRSVPLAQSQKRKAMRRLKRRRNEDIVDVASYMSNHSVFSYYDSRRPDADLQSVDDDCDDLDENNTDNLEWSISRFRRSDSALEQILLEIESAQSRVHEMRTHLETACKNSMDIRSTEAQQIHEGLPVSCSLSPSVSPDFDGGNVPVDAFLTSKHHHSSEDEREDIGIPGSASSLGDAAAELDITMGLFSAADIPLDQHADDRLVDNQAAEDGLQDLEQVSHAPKKSRVSVKEEAEDSDYEPSTSPKVSLPQLPLENVKPEVKLTPVLKPCNTGKKRGRPTKRRSGGKNKKRRVW